MNLIEKSSAPRAARGASYAETICTWFDISPRDQRMRRPCVEQSTLISASPRPGEITLICGPSGSGKSSLLRQLRRRLRRVRSCVDLRRMRLPADRAVIDCFANVEIETALQCLSSVGLAEAWCYLKTPMQPSDGQRWRLRLALTTSRAASGGETTLFCDEFAALLDRVTAAVVARALRRCVDSIEPASAVVATSHEDLIAALRPDRLVRCDYGKWRVSADFSRQDP